MVQLHCPCCKQLIEVNPDKGGIVISSCLESGEAPPTAPKEGPFFDKTLHPPALNKQAHEIEQARFKQALGDLPLGSAGTEMGDEKESEVLSKIITKYPSKIVSDNPLAKEVSDFENQIRKDKHREELKKDQEEAQKEADEPE